MFTAVAITMIAAPTHKVWEALVDPELIKKYFFGTEVESEWKIGSPIIYRGVWEGREYEDKGVILNMIPTELLEIAYWSSFSGLPDKPENYRKITYRLIPADLGTQLIVTQENDTEEAKKRAKENWEATLHNLKKLLERI